MSIETADFVVYRDGQPQKCQGSDLNQFARQSDEFILRRGDTTYKTNLAIGLGVIESSAMMNHDYNFGQYLKIINTDTGAELQPSEFCDACYHPSLREPSRLFDGIDTPEGRLQWATLGNSGIKSALVIDFPGSIPVYSSIKIRAGFSEFSQTGQLLINDQVVTELDAWDNLPQDFVAPYTGFIDTFAIRMKNVAPLLDPTYSNNTTGAINYIEIDGHRLTDNFQSTMVVLEEGTDMSIYKPFSRVKVKSGVDEVIIGEVDAANRTLWIFGSYGGTFKAGEEILVNIPGRETIDLPEILDDDLFVCTDLDGVTYRVTGAQFKELVITPEEPGCVPNDGDYATCKQLARSEYNRCRLLCESDYCASICTRNYEETLEKCERCFQCAPPGPDGLDCPSLLT
jgi:hypothetical protein